MVRYGKDSQNRYAVPLSVAIAPNYLALGDYHVANSEKLVKNSKKWRVPNKMTDFFGLLGTLFEVVLCDLTRIVTKIGQS